MPVAVDALNLQAVLLQCFEVGAARDIGHVMARRLKPSAEMDETQPLAGIADFLVQCDEKIRRRPYLVAELTGETGTGQDDGRVADGCFTYVKELERIV